jgi:hypothetical protein
MRIHENGTRGSRRALGRIALPLVLAIGLFGCDDFLTTEPKGQLTTGNFFTNEQHALQATNATYAMLRNWTVHTLFWVGMTDVVSDDATKGSTPNDAGYLIPFEELTWDAGNTVFSNTWAGYYDGIYRANVAIENIPGIEDMDPTLRDRLVGENQFLRAYYYVFLVSSYGGVPLITDVLAAGEYDQPRATADAVWSQIEQDLMAAIQVLPEASQYSAADMGRVTKGAARALLAKAHLYQFEYDMALQYVRDVVNSGEYSLYPTYGDIFTRAGENSSESVFEVQTVAIDGGNPGPTGGASQYSQVQGVRGTPNLGWGFNGPSPNLEESYEPGDPRLQATIMYAWEPLPDGTPEVVYYNDQMQNNRYNQKVFRPTDEPGGSGNSGVNIRRIRYADVLLMGAEAAFRTGDDAQALTWLNMVRARARGGMTVTLGFQPEPLADQIAVDVLGLGTSSRVVVRYVNPATQVYANGLRSFESVRDNGISPVPVRVTNLDVITAVDGTPITDMASFRAAVASYSAGQVATLDITRVDHSGSTPTTTTLTVDAPVTTLLPDISASGDPLLFAIWEERRHELAMEQHRWNDLIRQGRANSVMEALTCEDRALPTGCTALVFDDFEVLYPIPAAEVTVAELQQNPGYN